MGICNILWAFGIFCGNLVYFYGHWYLLWTFGIFYGHLVYFVAILYIFPSVGKLYKKKSGNPVLTIVKRKHS
jgi:hypothetical protein